MRETVLVKRILVHASALGHRLLRNNNGALKNERGRLVRYGLGPGTGDCIGWTIRTITQADVGREVAVFTSVEVKGPDGVVSEAQAAWHEAVLAAGGVSAIVRSTQQYEDAVHAE